MMYEVDLGKKSLSGSFSMRSMEQVGGMICLGRRSDSVMCLYVRIGD